MASLRIVRTAPAVAAVIIGSLFLQGIANDVLEVSGTACNSDTIEEITLEESADKVEMKCGADYSEFLPADLTKAYATDSVASSGQPVDLESLVHKAVLTVKKGDKLTHTLSVNHSTVVKPDKVFYYYCKKPSFENYCKLKVTVKTRAVKPATTCNATELNKILLDKAETSIKFACDSTYSKLLPDLKQAFISREADTMIALETLYPKATLVKDTSPDHQYTLTIPDRTSSKILHYRCQKDDDEVCEIEVTVEKNRAAPDGVPEPPVCSSTVASVDVKLSPENPGVAFTCGLDVPTLDPEDMTQVYDQPEMSQAESLSSHFKKAGLYTDPTVAAYTYFLYIPYREEKKMLYYKCKGVEDKECTVNITVEPNNNSVPVCQDTATGVYLSYEDFSENVKFKCGATYPNITPSDMTKVYEQDPTVTSSPEAVALTSVYSGAKLVSDGDRQSPTFTLTIPPHLPREMKKIYYQCKTAEDAFCTVHIRVAKKEPEMITCTNGKEEKVTITGPGEIVRFKCDNGMTLYPSGEQEVYDNRDNKCSTTASLTKLVPNAKLAVDTEDEEGKVITFTELPTSEKALCYSCSADGMPAAFSASFRAPQTSKQCKVLIDVKSAAQSLNAHTLAGHAFILVSFAGALFSIL